MNTRHQNEYHLQKQFLSVQRQLGKQNIVQYRIKSHMVYVGKNLINVLMQITVHSFLINIYLQ